jgi:hypothetical protein
MWWSTKTGKAERVRERGPAGAGGGARARTDTKCVTTSHNEKDAVSPSTSVDISTTDTRDGFIHDQTLNIRTHTQHSGF